MWEVGGILLEGFDKEGEQMGQSSEKRASAAHFENTVENNH